MTRKIKRWWWRTGLACFVLYFLPVSDFVKFIFGDMRIGNAYAGIRCSYDGGAAESWDIGGCSEDLQQNETAICTCPTDKNKVVTVKCGFKVSFEPDPDDQSILYPTNVPVIYTDGECRDGSVCINDSIQACSDNAGIGVQRCTNREWGGCLYESCKSGYILVGTRCQQECRIANGVGYIWDTDYDTDSSSSAV